MSVLRRRLMMADHYVGGGLLLHLDGINNTGHGHDPNPAVWTDLSGNGHDATLTRIIAGNLFGDRYMDGDIVWGEADLGRWVEGATVECVVLSPTGEYPYDPPDGAIMTPTSLSMDYAVSNWGKSSWIAYSGLGNLNGEYAGRIYHKACSGDGAPVYLNGVKGPDITVYGGSVRHVQLAHKGDQATRIVRAQIYAVRVYDRVLTADEVAHNYAVDKVRFGL